MAKGYGVNYRAALRATPYGFVKPGLGVSPNSGPPVGGLSLMSPYGFFGDSVNALLPNTAYANFGGAQMGAKGALGASVNGKWFFGLSGRERASIDAEYSSKKNKPVYNSYLRENRAKEKKMRHKRERSNLQLQKRRKSGFGAISDSLSGIVKPGPPNMRTFPSLGAYPNEVGPGNTPGGTAYNGSFVGPENPLLSYYFTYGRRRSVRKSTKKHRASVKHHTRSVRRRRRSMRRKVR